MLTGFADIVAEKQIIPPRLNQLKPQAIRSDLELIYFFEAIFFQHDWSAGNGSTEPFRRVAQSYFYLTAAFRA
jgi:hypothetical protein